LNRGLRPTGSLVERFGLFTIIVLGEVVFGVVDCISASKRDVKTITTGIAALVIGFGFWWIYFDLVGRRLPRPADGALAIWLLSHLPITLSITAAGAAMVSLIGHAHDARTPASTAWLLAGSVATGLLAVSPRSVVIWSRRSCRCAELVVCVVDMSVTQRSAVDRAAPSARAT
jgi:low temperature requirement protein LtrA